MQNPNHLTPEDFYHFIDGGLEGCSSGRIESHLTDCPECLETLAMIVRFQRPWTAEEESVLSKLPHRTPDKLLERLKPVIAASWKR